MPDRYHRLRFHIEWSLLGLHLIFFVLLLWIYTTHIVSAFGYEGYIDKFNFYKAIFASFAILASFMLLRNDGLPSYFFLNVVIALIVTPSLVIFSGADLPSSFMAVTWTAFAILTLVARYAKIPRIRMKNINHKILLRGLAILCLLFIVNIFIFGGTRFMNFNLKLVYQFREAASEHLPSIYGYLLPSFSKVIVPVGIVLSIICRQKLLLLMFIFCAVMFFAFSSHKSPLIIPIIVIYIYWFSKYQNGLALTLVVFILILIGGCIDLYLLQSGVGGFSGLFSSIGVRRVFIVPSWLNWGYYDFFSNNPYNYWAGSKLSLGMADMGYNLTISHVIGEVYFGKEGLGANTGWIGSGMAQAGYFGIALYSIVIGLILSFFDSYSKKLGYSFVLSTCMVSVLTMTTSSDLTTMLLTHGLVVLFLILIILNPNYENSAH